LPLASGWRPSYPSKGPARGPLHPQEDAMNKEEEKKEERIFLLHHCKKCLYQLLQ